MQDVTFIRITLMVKNDFFYVKQLSIMSSMDVNHEGVFFLFSLGVKNSLGSLQYLMAWITNGFNNLSDTVLLFFIGRHCSDWSISYVARHLCAINELLLLCRRGSALLIQANSYSTWYYTWIWTLLRKITPLGEIFTMP